MSQGGAILHAESIEGDFSGPAIDAFVLRSEFQQLALRLGEVVCLQALLGEFSLMTDESVVISAVFVAVKAFADPSKSVRSGLT